jgi:hypothetical protein
MTIEVKQDSKNSNSQSWLSNTFPFAWLKSFGPSKSGDTQNANTASAGVVETKNEVPEGAAEGSALLPSNSDATEAPTTTQSSWYSGVFKFFGALPIEQIERLEVDVIEEAYMKSFGGGVEFSNRPLA